MVKKRKLGQVKIQQSAFMIIALTLFFVLVGLFVLSFSLSDLSQKRAALEYENAVLLVSKLSNFPEFSCGSAFGTEKINCVDFDKAYILKSKIDSSYEDFFGVDGIKIVKIFPSSDVECASSNYPDCGILTVFDKGTNGVYKSSFVSLCRKVLEDGKQINKCEIARLMVKFE